MTSIGDTVGNVGGLKRIIETGEFDAVIAASPETVQWTAMWRSPKAISPASSIISRAFMLRPM